MRRAPAPGAPEFTPIDHVARIRVLRIHDSHNQKNTIAFIFRIHTIRTDRDHGF